MIRWEQLLCSETLREKEQPPKSWADYPMDPFEQDYREIISSPSFRHLQDKSQIYQLEKGDFVRTRLTHSLEVSTVAKQLGYMLVYNDKWNRIPPLAKLTPAQGRAIPTVLASAGLLHDMGNPPFGHEGENAINRWFSEHLSMDGFAFFGKPVRECLSEQCKRDLCQFEGNAQIVRMLSMSRLGAGQQEANVTFAAISTLLKYPANSLERDPEAPDLRVHKNGYYASEQELVRMVREKTGVNIPGQPHARNPLTLLLEAADDIAYVASDIEDAVSKKTISIGQLTEFMRQKIAELPEDGSEEHQMRLLTVQGILRNLETRLQNCCGEAEWLIALRQWTNYLKNWLMYVTAGSFAANWEAIMNGSYSEDLLKNSQHGYTVQILKDEMYGNVYPHLTDAYIASHNVVRDLVDKFAAPALYWDTPCKQELYSQVYINMIPEHFRQAYFAAKTGDRAYDLYLRFRMVLDYIGSMTDGSALTLYKKLNAYAY